MARLERLSWWLIVTALVWFAAGGILGLFLPALQAFAPQGGAARLYTIALTGHGVAFVFGGLFQLMAGLSLLQARSCMEETGSSPPRLLPRWLYGLLNGGLILLALANLQGFAPSYTLMYPLPTVGPARGMWGRGPLIVAFVGIALVLLAVLYLYPVALARTMWGRLYPSRMQWGRMRRDPGMLGMAAYIGMMPTLGLPVFLLAAVVFAVVLGLLQPEQLPSWCRIPLGPLLPQIRPEVDPWPFNVAFWLFAHNLMEAMGIMALAAVYTLIPLYTRAPTPRLYSPGMGVLAVGLYTLSAIPAFGHHLYTMISTSPPWSTALAQAASWLTGFAAAFTAFNIGATLWRDGLRLHPAPLFVLGGFLLYLIDGFVALQLATRAWNLRLHGTLYVTAHTMTILIAVGMIWLGMLYHHHPGLRGWPLEARRGFLHAGLTFLGALGMFYTLLRAGAEGIPRRAYPWPGDGPGFGVAMLLFGVLFALAQILFAVHLLRPPQLAASAPRLFPSGEPSPSLQQRPA
ncbi:cbb3-type cytochrome c oxidase subunit I [Thermoflexus hugenholtzii]